MKLISKSAIKEILGHVPLTAELYGSLRRHGQSLTADFSLDKLDLNLTEWRNQAENARQLLASDQSGKTTGKKVIIFGMLRYWLEHVTLLGIAMAGMGHTVSLAYLPYSKWKTPLDNFNLRRQSQYAHGVLSKAEPLLKIVPLATALKTRQLPKALENAIREVALRDSQYSMQVEEISQDSELYHLRLNRNISAAKAAFAWWKRDRPDVIILPNGTILEFGVLYQVARYLEIPTITYEFGEQHQRIWLAKNKEVMRQNTDDLWAARKDHPLTQEQLSQVSNMLESRQHANLWENFTRRWQDVPSAGGEQVRKQLELDQRPVVLLATNVIGDSLTLGRQVFSDSMTAWLERTITFIAQRNDVQFIARIHPGELVTKGPSVSDIVKRALPEIPKHIYLIPADAKINTYDLVQIADLGLVYTTTVGLEMVLSGLPVIVAGNTHYRAKGFTLDPDSWEGYFEILTKALSDPISYRPTHVQVEQAWNYAYRFFFEYPQIFPWHLLHMWKDLENWPIKRVLSDEGLNLFGKTFSYFSGEPITW